MAATLADIRADASIKMAFLSADGLAASIARTFGIDIPFGNAAGQANAVVYRKPTVATGTPLSIDLTNVPDPAGLAQTFTKYLGFIFRSLSTTAGEIWTIGGGANAVVGAYPLGIQPSLAGFSHNVLMQLDLNAGVTVDATHKIWQASVAAGAAVVAELLILGRQ